MEVVINGKSEAGDFSTVEQMLRERGLDPYLVVVELNGKILQKQRSEERRVGKECGS